MAVCQIIRQQKPFLQKFGKYTKETAERDISSTQKDISLRLEQITTDNLPADLEK